MLPDKKNRKKMDTIISNSKFQPKQNKNKNPKYHENYENETNKNILHNNMNIIPEQLLNIENTKESFKIKKQKYIYDPDIIIKSNPQSKIYHKDIHLCIYNIDTNGILPFIQFLLYKSKNKKKEELFLPKFKFLNNKKTIKEQSDKKIETIFSDWNKIPTYKGHIKYNNQIYMVYEKITENTEASFKKRMDDWWWCISSEIVDSMEVLNFQIYDETSNFFFNNNQLLYVLDKNNKPYENPIIGYHGDYYKHINFITVFGINKSSQFASMGPFYYFSTFRKALTYALWYYKKEPLTINNELVTIDDNGLYEKGGIVRFVLFTGKQKVFMNFNEDPDDKSSITKEEEKTREYVSKTKKIRDTDGKWSEHFDSAFIGIHSITLKDSTVNTKPTWVLKYFNQQLPLTYHYVDTTQTNLEKKFEDKNIFIE